MEVDTEQSIETDMQSNGYTNTFQEACVFQQVKNFTVLLVLLYSQRQPLFIF